MGKSVRLKGVERNRSVRAIPSYVYPWKSQVRAGCSCSRWKFKKERDDGDGALKRAKPP